MKRPTGSDADEWHLFLCEHLDDRATSPGLLTFLAVQIAIAIDEAFENGRRHAFQRVYELAVEDSK